MLSAGFVSEYLLKGFALTPGLFQLPKPLLSPGFGVPVSFEGSRLTGPGSDLFAEAHIP
jgi:hypothetical protein